MRFLAPATLERFSAALLRAVGVPAPDAETVGCSLVAANLRGMDSHGVMRIPYYTAAVREKRLQLDVALDVRSETAALLVCDACWGFGQVQMRRLIERLVPKARALGLAAGAMQRTGHIGRVGEWAELAAESGLASILFVNTHGAAPRVAPPGGREPRLGTNPLCVGVPTNGDPIVLDFGTSATAEGKVRVKRIAGQECPPGWLIDNQGKPTTDPNTLYGSPPGSILPLGGDQAYKGFGLALVIDMLAAGLSGGWCARPNPQPGLGNDVLMILLDPARFGGDEHFLAEVTAVATHVRKCPTVDDSNEILLPGDPERRTLRRRLADGIPIDDGNWQALVELAGQLGVAVPT